MKQLISLLFGFLLTTSCLADTLLFKIDPSVKDSAGNEYTKQTAITKHRVQYGTCTDSGAFGTVIGEMTVVMPIVQGFFTAPTGLYCGRVFPSNKFGEGKHYPVAVIGPLPGEGGSVTVTVTSP